MLLDQNIALTNNAPQCYRMLAAQVLKVTSDTNGNYGIAQADAVIFFLVVAAISIKIGRAHVELQSPLNLVCRLLLEKKKKTEGEGEQANMQIEMEKEDSEGLEE